MRYSATWDGVGAGLSGLCVVHCLVLPLLLVVLPGMTLLLDESVHRTLVLVLSFSAVLAFIPGYRLHRRRLPALLAGLGLPLLIVGAYGEGNVPETIVTVAGSLLLVVAHAFNHSFCRLCALSRSAAATDSSFRQREHRTAHGAGMCDCTADVAPRHES